MKATITLILFLNIYANIYSQEDFTAGMIKNDFFNHITFVPYMEINNNDSLYIDVDGDEINDFYLYSEKLTGSNDHDFEGSFLVNIGNTQFINEGLGGFIRDFQEGEVINDTSYLWNYNVVKNAIALLVPYNGIDYNDFLQNDTSFIGFRIFSAENDTLYGWMKIKAVDYNHILLFEIGSEFASFNDTVIYNITINTSAFNDINIYPNPTHSVLRLKSDKYLNSKIRIVDMNGVVVRSFTLNTRTIDVSDLPRGVYILELTGPDFNLKQRFIRE